MDGFYTTVLSVAAIILILMLTYVGILLYYAKSDQVFPPHQKPCPDYWEMDADGKCIIPIATTLRNRGELITNDGVLAAAQARDTVTPGVINKSNTNPVTVIDFKHAGWKTVYGKKSDLCNKKYWADSLDIQWDGVTNTNQC